VILDLPQGGPGWIFASAESLLALVIGAGVAGVCSGGLALSARNGGPMQPIAGRAFGASVVAMAGIGAAAALGVAGAAAQLSRVAASVPAHAIDGELALCFLLYLLVGATAAALDIQAMLQGGADGAHRFARQIWRLCVALFLAAGSFFLGQQKLLPALLRGTPLLIIPVFAPLVIVSFWLLRARLATMLRGPARTATIAMSERAA
jgi:hypothetical protein